MSDAYDQGFTAYIEGHKTYQCPYPDSKKGEQWEKGWKDAEETCAEIGRRHVRTLLKHELLHRILKPSTNT